ncbi:MAG: HAD family hydrolase [Ignavibacteriaceae bacterium]|nr:HAD family hydrolase [Ignavibacteriaceae bacterium]
MINKYKHIIWDWNGTLLDDTEFCVGIMNGMLTRRMMSNISKSYYKRIFTFPIRKYYEKIGLPIDDEQFVLLSKEFIYEYELNRLTCGIFEGAEEVLQTIIELGLSQSILSAYSQNTLEEIVAHFGLTKYFSKIKGLDNIYASSKIELGKQLMSELGLLKGEALLIGDTLHDKEAAEAIGADCVLIANGHQDKTVLASSGIEVFDSITHFKNQYFKD